MVYSALSVARYTISYCYRQNKPVSNLKLQKLLYYIWIEYYKSTKLPLFSDRICAWPLGPVIPEVYYEFCPFAGMPIAREYESELTSQDELLVDKAIECYINYSASTLVSMTHRANKPWDIVYCGGIGRRAVIPFPLIEELECGCTC